MKYTKLAILTVVLAIATLTTITSAFATGQTVNSKLGAKVFEASCSPCHAGGDNTVETAKTLKAAALKENGFTGAADVKKRVEQGKGVMPVFKDQLKPQEIDAVASYVWEKAQNNWK
jgi:cytochrome c6